MHNLSFWNNAIEVIDKLAAIDTGKGDFSLEEVLNSFNETYRGLFDPSTDFEEYVLVALVDRVGRILTVGEGERS